MKGARKKMSSIDRIKEWEATLPPQLRERIDSIVDQITEQMDAIVKREGVVDDLIKSFIRLCDEIGLPREQTSVFIKHKLSGIISDDTIERHLPKDRKRKFESLPRDRKSAVREIEQKNEIELSTDGKVYPEKPISDEAETVRRIAEIPPNEEILETAIDMSMAATENKEQENKELKRLVDQKQDEIEKLHLEIAEFKFQLSDVIAKLKNAKIEENAITHQLIAELKGENRRLKQAVREEIQKESFVPAAEVESPKTVWIAALNCFGLSRSLMQLSMKLTDDSVNGKILFDIAIDGSIKNPRLEATSL